MHKSDKSRYFVNSTPDITNPVDVKSESDWIVDLIQKYVHQILHYHDGSEASPDLYVGDAGWYTQNTIKMREFRNM